ncbi:MAG: hypothetical protein V7638_3921 [Acidobacteriota bacterium]
MFCFSGAVGAVIPQQQLAVLLREPFNTAFEATIFQLDPVWIVRRKRCGLRKFPPQVFEVNFVSDAEEVARAVAAKFFFDLFELAGDAIDGFVGEVFGLKAPASGEDLDETATNSLVIEGSLFAIGVKPIKQRVKIFL